MNRAEKTAKQLRSKIASLENAEKYKEQRDTFFERITSLKGEILSFLNPNVFVSASENSYISQLFDAVLSNRTKGTGGHSMVYWDGTGFVYYKLLAVLHDLAHKIETSPVPTRMKAMDWFTENWSKIMIAIVSGLIVAFANRCFN